MLDYHTIQKRRKQEQKEQNKYHPSSWDEHDTLFIIIIGAIIVFVSALFILMFFSYEDSQNKCEKVGGEYVEVGKEFTGRQTVTIYGCVKSEGE